MDRLGDTSGILQNLGPTFILITVAVVITIVIISIIAGISKTCEGESRCKKLIIRLHSKVFYDMIIRYLTLNSLKINMTIMISLRQSKDKTLPIYLLIAFSLVPFVLSAVLLKIGDDLDSQDTLQRYGNLYRVFNHKNSKERRNIIVYHVMFFARRNLFIVLTVFAFDYPSFQIAGHMSMTFLTAAFLVH